MFHFDTLCYNEPLVPVPTYRSKSFMTIEVFMLVCQAMLHTGRISLCV